VSFKFIKTIDPNNKFSIVSITHEMPDSDHTLLELLGAFEDFLRGCGYSFDGSVAIEPPETDDP
jgi:hypothetical protein